jgi:predicted ATPase/DNA-binding CsgD family transcriptional regulator
MFSEKVLPDNEVMSKRAVEILHLLAEGLSDREIAEQLFVAVNTVKWYNRQIYSMLGVGSRTEAIAHAHKLKLLEINHRSTATLQLVQPVARHNLPVKPTQFIGRERELTVIKGLLEKSRLLTLVGALGVGKTRLALQAAWEVRDSYPEGVYFVALESVTDPEAVIPAIASAVGIEDAEDQHSIEALKQSLYKKRVLLVLDNVEHLQSAAVDLSELLAALPQLRVIVTSRVPLHIYGEQQYTVPPMSLPDLAHADPMSLMSCESIALFMQHACAVRPDVELTCENASDIVQICHRLEGIPLAIELAAKHLKMRTPRSLLAYLELNLLDTLTGGACDLPARQRTLRSSVDWSYNLLDEREKVLFARLAVFDEPFSLEAIEAVCGEGLSTDVFNGLISLMDHSLIAQTVSANDEPQFHLLDMVREYAAERLEESTEREMIYCRYVEVAAPLSV